MTTRSREGVVQGARQPAWPLMVTVLAAFAGGAAVGVGARALDHALPGGVLLLSLGAYRALLSAAVSGLITVVAFALWMRTVMTGMMAGKIAPRVLARHLDDQYQRFVLTAMTAALGVAAAALAGLPAEGPVEAVVSLPLVLGLAVTALAGILISLNRAMTDVSVPNVLFDLVARGKALLRAREAARRSAEAPVDDPAALEQVAHVRSVAMGWVVAIDREALLANLPPGQGVVLRVRMGQLLDEGDVVASVSCDIEPHVESALRSAIALGRHDGRPDDFDDVLAQLVDMACSALAPGTNDTSTGEEAMEATGLLLRALVGVGDPVRHVGQGDRQLLDVASQGVRETVRRSIERLRITTATHPRSASQLVRLIGDLADVARGEGRDDVLGDLSQQVQRLAETADASELSAADVDELVATAQSRGLLDGRPPRRPDDRAAGTD